MLVICENIYVSAVALQQKLITLNKVIRWEKAAKVMINWCLIHSFWPFTDLCNLLLEFNIAYWGYSFNVTRSLFKYSFEKCQSHNSK